VSVTTGKVVTVKLADVLFDATVADAGTEAAAGSLEAKETDKPPVGAGSSSVTIPDAVVAGKTGDGTKTEAICRLFGYKLRLELTVTEFAVAVIVAKDDSVPD
jgi:hypothetical protein